MAIQQRSSTATNINIDNEPVGEAIRLISLVLVWFVIQSGIAVRGIDEMVLAQRLYFPGIMLQPLGGITGAAIFGLLKPSVLNGARPRAVLAGLLAAVLVAMNISGVAHLLSPTVAFQLCACILDTVLFLKECAIIAERSTTFILRTLSLFAFIVLAFIAITLIPLPPVGAVCLYSLLELVALGGYLLSLKELPLGLLSKTRDQAENLPSSEDLPLSQIARGGKEVQTDADTGQTGLPWQLMVHVLLCYLVIMFSWMLIEMTSSNVYSPLVGLLSSATALVAFLLSFARQEGHLLYWQRTRQITLPLVVLAMPLWGIGTTLSCTLALLCAQIAYRYFLLSSYVEIFVICKNTLIAKEKTLSGIHIALYLGMLLGIGAAIYLVQTFEIDIKVICTAGLAATLCFAIASCWLGDDRDAAKVWGRRIELTPRGRQDLLAKQACQLVANKYGLTPKETETLYHVVQGGNIEIIAERLFVSVNTVRTHIRSIYSKLDVHSRAEVYRIFEASRDTLPR